MQVKVLGFGDWGAWVHTPCGMTCPRMKIVRDGVELPYRNWDCNTFTPQGEGQREGKIVVLGNEMRSQNYLLVNYYALRTDQRGNTSNRYPSLQENQQGRQVEALEASDMVVVNVRGIYSTLKGAIDCRRLWLEQATQ
jgi:hypothetical protein